MKNAASFISVSDSQTVYDELKSSPNVYNACYGRFLSQLTPVLQDIIKQEQQRGTDPNILVNIAPGLATSLLFQLLPPFQFPQTEQLLIETGTQLINDYKNGSVQYLQAIKASSQGGTA